MKMRTQIRILALGLLSLTLSIQRSLASTDDFFDSLDSNLKFATFNNVVTGRFSGELNLEQYYVQQPPPGLVYTSHNFLTNPSLALNLDMQIGPQVYMFGQVRLDRGYDPTDGSAKIDPIQYAARYTPWEDGIFNLQVGKFATMVGTWTHRHDPWDNAFITPPLLYENLTGIWGSDAVESAGELHGWTSSAKNLRLPIIWDADYATGAAIFGSVGKFDYSAEIKNAALASSPGSWNATNVGFENPTYSGRLGWRPNEAWNLGVSSSVGTYLEPIAADSVAPGESLRSYKEITIAQDASYAWHHWQLWAECYETRFQVPAVCNADTVAYYVETRYKFTPEVFGAVRWNQQIFGTIPNGAGGSTTWGSNIWSVDAAVTYRFTSHIQAKIQYSFYDQGNPVPQQQSLVAGQLTVRF